MAKFAGGRIEAFVGPRELGAADDLEQTIVGFIGEAEASLDIAIQELDSRPIAQAIIDAAWRRVSVRLVLEQDYLQDRGLPKVVAKPGETDEAARSRVQWGAEPPRVLDTNRDILRALLRSGVHVSADYNPKIFHQKFIIRDYRRSGRATSGLLTGSANFTKTDCHSNLNHVVIFHDKGICKEYRTEFDQIKQGQFGRGQHGEVPRAINVANVPVKILFAPDHTPELEIMKQILKAQAQVLFAIFTFAGSSGIDDAMIMAKKAGLEVKGVLDPGQATHAWAATKWLHEAGVELYKPRRVRPFRKLHHKLLVVDDAIVVAGSFNYTAPANEYNDENIFILGSPYPDLPPEDGGPVDPSECAAIAAFFRAEIERIISMSERHTPQ